MYALDEVREINIPYADFNRALGYKPNFVIQGFRVLKEDQSEKLTSAFGLEAQRFEWPANPDEVERAIQEFDELDRRFQAVQRVEQGALREHLLRGRGSGECLLCGRTFHADFLVAAHIKRRASCNDSEKRDLRNIGMLNCKFGCDELYERGYLSVDKEGQIHRSSKLTGPFERKYVTEVVQRNIAVPPEKKDYFAWHHENRFKP